MSDLFERLKSTKENDKHIAIVEALVGSNLQFIEIQEMVYQITNSVFKKAFLYVRTGKIQVTTENGRPIYQGSFEQLVAILKGV